MVTGAPTWAIPTKNALIPPEGPKTVPVTLDFVSNPSIDLDFSNMMQLGYISLIQGVYIDNSQGAAAVNCITIMSDQIISCPAGYQGYFPLLCPSNQAKFTLISTGNGAVIPAFFYNMPLPAVVWSASQIGSTTPILVRDATLDALLVGGFLPVVDKVYGNGDHLLPTRGQTVTAVNGKLVFGTAVTANIIVGAPGFFITGMDIQLTGDAFLAAPGYINVSVKDGATTLWQTDVALLGAAPAVNLANQILMRTADFGYTSPNNASTLTVNVTNVNFHGELNYNFLVGTTNIQ